LLQGAMRVLFLITFALLPISPSKVIGVEQSTHEGTTLMNCRSQLKP
jgi:hypothetical protein